MLENDRTWKQDYLYRMFSHHTKDKEKENYVVNAIWARLDDLNVKPVTQQYVRRPNGYALIDLYFPQINYGVECDEAYTFAKSKGERGEDAYRFIGIFQWSETTPSGEHIYKRMASDMKLK